MGCQVSKQSDAIADIVNDSMARRITTLAKPKTMRLVKKDTEPIPEAQPNLGGSKSGSTGPLNRHFQNVSNAFRVAESTGSLVELGHGRNSPSHGGIRVVGIERGDSLVSSVATSRMATQTSSYRSHDTDPEFGEDPKEETHKTTDQHLEVRARNGRKKRGSSSAFASNASVSTSISSVPHHSTAPHPIGGLSSVQNSSYYIGAASVLSSIAKATSMHDEESREHVSISPLNRSSQSEPQNSNHEVQDVPETREPHRMFSGEEQTKPDELVETVPANHDTDPFSPLFSHASKGIMSPAFTNYLLDQPVTSPPNPSEEPVSVERLVAESVGVLDRNISVKSQGQQTLNVSQPFLSKADAETEITSGVETTVTESRKSPKKLHSRSESEEKSQEKRMLQQISEEAKNAINKALATIDSTSSKKGILRLDSTGSRKGALHVDSKVRSNIPTERNSPLTPSMKSQFSSDRVVVSPLSQSLEKSGFKGKGNEQIEEYLNPRGGM